MKISESCYECLRNLIYQAAELATDDKAMRGRALKEALKILDGNFSCDEESIVIATKIHDVIKQMTGNPDPYYRMKQKEMEVASELYYEMKSKYSDGFKGLLKLAVLGNTLDFFRPFDVIKKLRGILIERPHEFRYLLRVIPIERVVKTDMDEIVSVTRELASRIEENETFRVTVEKRFTEVSGNAIIKAVASDIRSEVNLSNPDKIVLIEIVGGFVGISVIRKNDIISVLKEKVL